MCCWQVLPVIRSKNPYGTKAIGNTYSNPKTGQLALLNRSLFRVDLILMICVDIILRFKAFRLF